MRLHEAGFLVRETSRAFAEEVAAFAVPDKPFTKVCKRQILHTDGEAKLLFRRGAKPEQTGNGTLGE